MTINRCRLLQFPKVVDHRGNLTFIEHQRHVPFDIKRVFYVYDIPSGESRGAHAHHRLEQVIVCLAGSLDVHLDDGQQDRIEHLNRPWQLLYIPPMLWASEGNFHPGSICLVLTSDLFAKEDYIRDYDEFRPLVGSHEA